MVDLCNVGYQDPIEVLQVACTNNSPEEPNHPPLRCRERVPPLQLSSNSDDSTSSFDDDDDDKPNYNEGFGGAKNQISEEEEDQ